jgi:hypothetical protein
MEFFDTGSLSNITHTIPLVGMVPNREVIVKTVQVTKWPSTCAVPPNWHAHEAHSADVVDRCHLRSALRLDRDPRGRPLLGHPRHHQAALGAHPPRRPAHHSGERADRSSHRLPVQLGLPADVVTRPSPTRPQGEGHPGGVEAEANKTNKRTLTVNGFQLYSAALLKLIPQTMRLAHR